MFGEAEFMWLVEEFLNSNRVAFITSMTSLAISIFAISSLSIKHYQRHKANQIASGGLSLKLMNKLNKSECGSLIRNARFELTQSENTGKCIIYGNDKISDFEKDKGFIRSRLLEDTSHELHFFMFLDFLMMIENTRKTKVLAIQDIMLFNKNNIELLYKHAVIMRMFEHAKNANPKYRVLDDLIKEIKDYCNE